ncbi:hypothetical protein ACF090_40730 [Streptomyces sp. NPDC014892]
MTAGWALDLFRGSQTRAHGDIWVTPDALGRTPHRRCWPP